jgi:hypothetical protein
MKIRIKDSVFDKILGKWRKIAFSEAILACIMVEKNFDCP